MDKKQEIIRAAIKLFATSGYERTSISTICEYANVSKGGLFHHFKNKEELLREVFVRMEQIVNEVGDKVDAANEGQSPKERLVTLLNHIFLSMSDPEQRLYYQFDFQVLCQPSTRKILEDLIDERYQRQMESFETILRDIPTADSVVDNHMLIAEIDGIAVNYLFAKEGYPLEEIQKKLIKKYLLLLGL